MSLSGNVVSLAPLINGIRGISLLVIQSSRKIDGTRDNFRLFMLLKMYFAMTVYLQITRKEPSHPQFSAVWPSCLRRIERRLSDV